MKRTLGLLFVLVFAGLTGACSSAVTETNANRNTNANTVPANVGVVTNNNGNKNTAGVRSINDNRNDNPRNGNTTH
jgi:hypothetical protein